MNYDNMIDLLNQMNIDDLLELRNIIEQNYDLIDTVARRSLIIRGLGKLRDNSKNFTKDELKVTNEFIAKYNQL